MNPIRPATLIAAALALLAALPVRAELSCDAKRDSIRKDMAIAKEKGQTHRLKGLERALAGVDENCTDEGLRDAYRQDIEKKRAEVAERENDLRRAQANGDPDKIANRQRKLKEEQAELDALLRAHPEAAR